MSEQIRDGEGYVVIQSESRQQAMERQQQQHTEREKPSGKKDPTPCTLIAVSHLEATLLLLNSAPPSYLQTHLRKVGRGETPVGQDTDERE
jgi:hypothetical protein